MSVDMLDETANKLLEGFQGSEDVPEERGELPEAPSNTQPSSQEEDKVEEPLIEGKEQENKPKPTPMESGWRKKAFDHARKFFKDKPDLTEEQLLELIFKNYVGAGKSIERHAKQLKDYETQVAEHGKYKKFYDELFNMPEWQALMSNKAKVVMLEELERMRNGGYAEEDPTASYVKQLEQKISSLENRYMTDAQRREQEQKQLEQNKRNVEIDKKLDEEFKTVCEKYPLFKQWTDEYNKSHIPPPELEEIYEIVENDHVPLRYAISQYFQENKLPEVIKKTKQEAIENLKKKAKSNTEEGTNSVDVPKHVNFSNADNVAEHLFELTFNKKR